MVNHYMSLLPLVAGVVVSVAGPREKD
uniref:Uncharacterized protein n=1 Tax=Arundo donax TaxID=35708 RepID=A0A0A8ZTQ7_ARUDO